MRYMNDFDIMQAQQAHGHHPILGPAVQTLVNLVEWTNCNSDGWAYWPKPCRAAAKLMALIEGDDHPNGRSGARFDDEREDVTVAGYKAALRPIKSFRTRQSATFQVVEI